MTDTQCTGDRAASIVINHVPIEWNAEKNRFRFFGIEAIILWKNPSLLSILKPLRDELGEALYGLLLAYEAARGTYEDYHAMVAQLGNGFEEGFVNWGRAVSGAGWGSFDLEAIDWQASTARVRIQRPWELMLFRADDPQHAIPFLNGKLSGIFSWAFDRHCRATVEVVQPGGDGQVLVSIAPSAMTLERELARLREDRGLSDTEYLQTLNRELRAHRDRLFEVLEAAGEFVIETDRQFRIVFATQTLSSTLGHGLASLEGTDFRRLLTEDGQATVSAWLDRGDTGVARDAELGAVTAAGAVRRLAVGITPTTDMHGATTGYRIAGRDVTEAREAQEELQLMAAAFRSSQAVVITDRRGRIERINDAFRKISGYGDEVMGQPLQSLWAPRGQQTRDHLSEALTCARQSGIWEGEVCYRRAGGEAYPVWQATSACRDAQGFVEHLVTVFHDISEQKRLEKQLEWQATHDAMTGLGNRSLLEHFLEREIHRARRYGRSLSLILLDIDHFKRINDSHGHDAGDAVLREMARRLEASVRASDVIARWGGEEFMLLAPETPPEQGLELAEKLRLAIKDKPFSYAGTVTASAGVTCLREEDDFDALFRRVDQALYAAKQEGRDRIVVR